MKVTDEQRQEITELSKLQFEPEDIALILDLDVSEFQEAVISEKQNDISRAFKKGTLLAQSELRKSVFNEAKKGSTSAQKQFFDLIDEQKRALQKLNRRK